MGRVQRNERGATLIEVVLGVAVALVVVAAGYTVMTGTEQATTTNDLTTQMQQNARVAMELVTQDLKMAGFGMTSAVGACTYAMMPADNTPAGPDTGPDSVSLAIPTVLSTLAAQANGPINTIALQSGAVAAMTPSGFAVGALISIGGVISTSVSGISGDVLTLASTIGAPAVFPVGTQVYWLQCIPYTIGTTTTVCAGNAPCLLRNGVAIAEGIEDLQLAYACDGCTGNATPDGIIDDQNGSNTFDAADFIYNTTWMTSPLTPDTIRLVRVNIVAREIRSDPIWNGTAPVIVEDHNPANPGDPGFNQQTYQQIRRRLLTRTVDLRNQGLSS